MPKSHIREDLLERYAMSTLDEEAIAGIEEHLLECALCQDRLASADEFLAVFRAAAMQLDASTPQPERIRPRLPFLWAAAAAALVLMAVLISRDPGATLLAPPSVVMQSQRGPEAGARVASSRPFLLVFDIARPATPAACEIEIVNSVGKETLKTGAEVRGGRLTASIARLPRGSYWVRVFRKQETRDLIAEYALLAD